MSQYKITWGVRSVVPEGARAAWGARAIYQPSSPRPLDLVWNRQSVYRRTDGAGCAKRSVLIRTPAYEARVPPEVLVSMYHLLSLLNGGILDTVQEVTRGGDPGSQEVAVLYEDDEVRVVGSPQGSHGYYYVTAWLKEAQ